MMKPAQLSLCYLILIFVILSGSGCHFENTGSESHQESQWTDRFDNYTDWGIYRGDKKGNAYSELSQINIENVHQLELAWEYQTRELRPPGMQSNPIIIDGLMYLADPEMNLVALDAATGEEVWLFNPDDYHDEDITRGQLLRAVVFWEDENENNQRIFHFVRDFVFAVDPLSGELIDSFGQNGFIDLKEHHVWDPEDLADGQISITSPGITYQNYVIWSARIREGNVAAPGNIHAFDAMTGEFQWVFHTVPLEGQYGYETTEWEEGMIYGANNPWGGFTVDEERGWVFAATGQTAPAFIYGGSRKGENLFANSILALDATTGERIWHFQTICHDIWDYDLPPPPALVTINSDGEYRDVVVQTGKQPSMFILDRDTGEPVFPVVDKPVPAFQGVPGEQPCETQPWPLKPEPLVRTSMYESDISRITPESHEYVLEEFKKLRTGPVYTPPSIEGTIITPGIHGGAQWGGGAFDPETNIYYVNVNNVPFVLQLQPIEPDGFEELTAVQRGANIYNANCAACHGANREGATATALDNLQLSTEEIQTIIEEGFGYMPSFSYLADDELSSLMAYLESDADETEAPRLFDDENGDLTWSGEGYGREWTTSTPQYVNTVRYFVDHMGYPAIQPPWGELVAVDIAEGEILWKVPLGEYPELVEMGITDTGTENIGGPALTAGGLIFIAATADSKFRAFDKNTGEILWEYQMEALGLSSPSVYEIDGKQYVAIVAGGGARRYTAEVARGLGRTLYVFALPD